MAIKVESLAIKDFGILTAKQIRKKLDISQPTLSRWVKTGKILKLSHGFYIHPQFEIPPQELDFAIACATFGSKSAVGGLTALFHYGLTDQAPYQVWVVVPPSKAYSNRFYRTLRTKTSSRHGINVFNFYRITNIERSIIEGFKFATKIGPQVAITAARKALSEGLTTEKKLGAMATKLKLRSAFEKYWDAIVI